MSRYRRYSPPYAEQRSPYHRDGFGFRNTYESSGRQGRDSRRGYEEDPPYRGRPYRDHDIYENEFGGRDHGHDPYRRDGARGYSRGADYFEDEDRYDEGPGFFERAGERIRDTWNRWTHRDPEEDDRRARIEYEERRFPSDRYEWSYGTSIHSRNRNRGHQHRSPYRRYHSDYD